MADDKSVETDDDITPLFPAWHKRFGHWDAHHRLFIALGVAAVVFAAAPWSWHWATRAVVTWIAYSASALLMTWYVILSADPSEAAREACIQDSSRTAIFIFVVLAAIFSVFAVGAELGTAKGLDRAYLAAHILFSLVAIFTSWSLVHTVFTMRYAHVYYNTPESDEAHGGLSFPEEDKPDYLDFAYFSFVIGMCFQTSDVSITSRRLRRLVLVHSVISFGFNLAILGLSINMVSGLFS